MGLTENQKRLIKAVAGKDLPAARKCALACVSEDTTAKNKSFCTSYHKLLSNSPEFIQLPFNVSTFLFAEDVSKTFKISRYFLSDREREAYETIVRMNFIAPKLLEMDIPYMNTTLLYGESGTGKTTFAKYVAFKLNLPFYYLNFSHLIDSYLGNTAKNIATVFQHISTTPCVFLLDEIDCISTRRTNSNAQDSNGEMSRITISLMQEFDKLTNEQIIIGATNRKDCVDEALLRRFSLKHEVKLLEESEKHLFVEKFLSDIDIAFTEQEISKILVQGNTQSELKNLIVEEIARKIETEYSPKMKN